MFNLLPNSEKKSIESAYIAKRYQLFLTFLLATVMVAIIFLTPSFIAIQYSKREAKTELEAVRSVLSSNDQELSRQLSNGQRKVIALNQETATKSSDFIATVINQSGLGTKINSIFYQKQNDATSTLAIRGVASTRGNLLLFIENLREEETFDTVSFPVSNFAKDSNIDFTVDITLK